VRKRKGSVLYLAGLIALTVADHEFSVSFEQDSGAMGGG